MRPPAPAGYIVRGRTTTFLGYDAITDDAGFLPLGAMKGNVGDQNYDIPADVDLARYHSVTIWCHRFGVNFGTAPLSSKTTVATSAGHQQS